MTIAIMINRRRGSKIKIGKGNIETFIYQEKKMNWI